MSIAPPPVPPPIPPRLRPKLPGMNRSQLTLLVVAVLVVIAVITGIALLLANMEASTEQEETASVMAQAKARQDEREQAYRAQLAQAPEGAVPPGWDMSEALEKLEQGDFILVCNAVDIVLGEYDGLRKLDFVDVVQRLDNKASLSAWEERLHPRRCSVEEMRRYLLEFLQNSAELDAIAAASRLGLYFVPYDLERAYYEHYTMQSRQRSAGALLAARAYLEALAGNVDAALEAYEDAVRFAELTANDPYLEHVEIRYAIEQYADRAIWALLDAAELTEKHMRRILRAMETRADTSRIKELIVEDVELLPARYGALEFDDPITSFFLRAADIYDPESLKQAATELAARVDIPFASFVEEGEKLAEELAASEWFFEEVMDAAIDARREQLRSNWKRELLSLAMALKRYRRDHGEYPETLKALREGYIDAIPIDPCTSKPVGYLRDGNAFCLFTPAPDEIAVNGETEWQEFFDDIPHDAGVLWEARN